MAGSYIGGREPGDKVHYQPDPRTPDTACGLSFLGKEATRHPIVTGGAFDCDTCKAAWEVDRPALFTCPTSPTYVDGRRAMAHTVIGCGREFRARPDSEGLVDCPFCGIWFNPEKETAS